MFVKNLNNTTGKVCSKCDSWLDHYKNFVGFDVTFCARLGCDGEAQVGAHVKKHNEGDDAHYIIPLCKACNSISSDEPFELSFVVDLAPATPCK